LGAALFVLGGEGGIQVYRQNIFEELERYFIDSHDTDTPKVNSKGVYRILLYALAARFIRDLSAYWRLGGKAVKGGQTRFSSCYFVPCC